MNTVLYFSNISVVVAVPDKPDTRSRFFANVLNMALSVSIPTSFLLEE